MNLNLFWGRLTAKLELGNLLSEPTRVHGGFMHMMYRLDTATGTYIVKLLNPNVMKRPSALENYSVADTLESILEESNIPIVPSLIFDDRKMQEIDGQYFYVYSWYDGKALKDKDITQWHCQEIGRVLSRIHHINVKHESYQRSPINIDWDYYIKLAKEQSPLIYGLLVVNKKLLYESQNSGNIAIQNLPALVTICHNDMDSKNILWTDNDFKIVDLECLAYASPYLEMFELALCWSGYEECSIDFDLFTAFISAYFEDVPKPSIDWTTMYYSNYGRLEWLEYNVKRALMIECDTAEEQALAIGQVKETLDHVIYYNDVKNKILDCLARIPIN